MSNYSFILDDMKFSYSSVSTFETCKGGFKLTYIDAEDRINNAFSSYGNLIHETLELFFKDKLKIEDMAGYYEDNFDEFIKENFPSYPQGMKQNYYNRGLEFFQKFEFDKSLYEIVFVEDYINAKYQGIEITVKPDLILKEISTNNYYLIDYKTAKLKLNKKDQEKQLSDYKKQFLMYVYFLFTEKNIEIKEMRIWFIRDGIEKIIPVDSYEAFKTMEWVEETVSYIKNEEEWEFNNTKENKYFCDNICSMRKICKWGGEYGI